MTDSDSDYEYSECIIQKCVKCNFIFKNYKPNIKVVNCIMCRTDENEVIQMN